MSTIEWADPPEHANTRHDWDATVTALKSAPEKWAVVLRGMTSPSQAMAIKQGRIKAFRPAGTFEARAILDDERNYDIYARFVGEK